MSADRSAGPGKAWGVVFDRPIPYAEALAVQERVLAARIAERIPDTVLLLEHTPVITLGRRGRNNHLLAHEAELQQQGIDLVTSSRGGDVTFHGPGQAIMYPIVGVSEWARGSHGFLSLLEQVAIGTAAHFGVDGFRREGMAGAWTDTGKYAAIGFKLKRWVSYHGMSLNVDVDLSGFDLIVGCGLTGESVTSLKNVLGDRCPSIRDVQQCMARMMGEFAGVELEVFTPGQAPEALADLLLAQ